MDERGRASAMTRPSFLVLGAPKAGTTSLHHWLGQHPDVLLAEPKEPHFFDAHYHRGLDWYWRTHFAGWTGQRAVGEATPSYLPLGFVAPRIARDLPDCRLIVSLRHPVQRAYSSWWTLRQAGREKRSFERAVLDELQALAVGIDFDGPDGARLYEAQQRVVNSGGELRLTSYVSAGHYVEHLRRYGALFPPERLRVLLFEELLADPRATVRTLWTFLGVDPAVHLGDATARNVALGALAARLYASRRVRALAETMPARPRRAISRWLTRLSPRPPLHPDMRRLLTEHYRAHNRELERLLDRDLSPWGT
jgi:hypothetical protein